VTLRQAPLYPPLKEQKQEILGLFISLPDVFWTGSIPRFLFEISFNFAAYSKKNTNQRLPVKAPLVWHHIRGVSDKVDAMG
jgi:hypothetical protein